MTQISCSVLALCALAAGNAAAQRVQLDDSLSPVDTFAVDLGWEPGAMRQALAAMLANSSDTGPPLAGRVDNVEVRLDTRDFVGRNARIYLALPATIAGLASQSDLELQWNATTPFISGAVRPGDSMLVYEGVIDNIVTSAVFTFALRLDRGPETDTIDVEPYYELEILP